jgi:hypothetical protein
LEEFSRRYETEVAIFKVADNPDASHERRVERPSEGAETDAGVTAPKKGPPKRAKLRASLK